MWKGQYAVSTKSALRPRTDRQQDMHLFAFYLPFSPASKQLPTPPLYHSITHPSIHPPTILDSAILLPASALLDGGVMNCRIWPVPRCARLCRGGPRNETCSGRSHPGQRRPSPIRVSPHPREATNGQARPVKTCSGRMRRRTLGPAFGIVTDDRRSLGRLTQLLCPRNGRTGWGTGGDTFSMSCVCKRERKK